MTVHCPICGLDNPEEAYACLRCGSRLSPSTADRLRSDGDRCLLAGRYRILTFLGGGGFGSVFLAEDTELGEKVALKLLRPELTQNERIIERFRREIRIARKLSHRNIVRIHELHREEDALFFTMEHLEGDDVKNLIEKKPNLSDQLRYRIAID
ncbi:protein kinase, partial [Acidobacteriota bacterium]